MLSMIKKGMNFTAKGQGLVHGEALNGPANDLHVDCRFHVPDETVRCHLHAQKNIDPKDKPNFCQERSLLMLEES